MNVDLRHAFPENRPNGLVWPLAQILVVERYGLLYRPIAKNACSSLKRMMVSLSDIDGKELMLSAPNIHDSIDLYRTGAKLLDLDHDRAVALLTSPDVFKFAVVRDPFERLVSAYVEKFVINRTTPGNRNHTGAVIAAVQGGPPDFDRGITFADFVHTITAQDPATLDPHWTPQHRYLTGVDYDRLYQVGDLDRLRQDLEPWAGRPIQIEHRNRSQVGRPRIVAGSAERLPRELRNPKRLDKSSFLDDDLQPRIAAYFGEDDRLFARAGA